MHTTEVVTRRIYLSQKSTTKSKKKKKARFILSGPRSLPMLTLSLSLFYNNIFPFVKAYFRSFLVSVYKKSLGDDISSETSGDFRKALLTLADVRFYVLLFNSSLSYMTNNNY